MPIYEYQCKNCGHELEVMQKFSDQPLKACPECHKDDLQKLVSSSAFHLKGGGWYVTDIKGKDKPKAGGTDAADTSGSDKKESKSSDNSSNSNDQAAG